jgi:hypothetical protein
MKNRKYFVTMKLRRIIAIIFVVLGGVLIYLAPETIGGFILIGLGVVIEAVGIFLEHRR